MSIKSWKELLFHVILTISVVGFVVALPTSDNKRASPDGLSKIKHVVLFMQENRSFDHYFGTMAGVRGFNDPNVVISSDTGKPSFYQPISPTSLQVGEPLPPPAINYLLPWYWNHEGGDSNDRYQCALSGSNGWKENHQAYNNGTINRWATKNTPYSMGYYKRADIPYHFGLAEGWTVADAYHESVIASTNPNRVSWASASLGVQQSRLGQGGPVLDNNENEGCETALDGSTKYSCYPYKWKTVPEYLEEAGISWQVYQDTDNFGDNPLAWFSNFQSAKANSSLANRGMSFIGLNKFYEDAKAGTLPSVSYVIGPTDLSEHPPYGPIDGAWLQQQVVDAVTSSPKYSETALLVSYDETGGWADHVMAPLPDKSTASDEYFQDPYDPTLGQQPVGPGFRLPFYIISPYTRNGGVFTEVASHESQTLFLEKWASANGKPFQTTQMTSWRRQHMSDLTRMFDFSSFDTSVPSLPTIRPASKDSSGNYNGASVCRAKYGGLQPSVPYTQKDSEGLTWEKGFKKMRGTPSEGHYITIETSNQALTFDSTSKVTTLTPPTVDHSSPQQRFILHSTQRQDPKNPAFLLQPFNTSSLYLSQGGSTTTDPSRASIYLFQDLGDGAGYSIVESKSGDPIFSSSSPSFSIFSVSY
ncbi:phosphoesterase-domain-containing protein [Violaceomyces palustris]|uniref:Phosphoesterase-domain-containing protein n=1 Tax=Violaceomyces palustris TaxID=1673888 RepID=A0ACD0NNJ1_9BASI|nr:phosphoesterase-domain-containing protein [Violaceomyces palustris]